MRRVLTALERLPLRSVATHGGWSGYSQGCRCWPCEYGGCAYQRERYAAKKEAAA